MRPRTGSCHVPWPARSTGRRARLHPSARHLEQEGIRLAWADEVMRGIVAFGTSLGRLPAVAFRRTRESHERPRVILLKHASRIRSRVGVSYTLDGEPLRADQSFVLVYNQASFVEDLTTRRSWSGSESTGPCSPRSTAGFPSSHARRRVGDSSSSSGDTETRSSACSLTSSRRSRQGNAFRWHPRGIFPPMARWATSSAARSWSPSGPVYRWCPWPYAAATTSFLPVRFGCDPGCCATAWASR